MCKADKSFLRFIHCGFLLESYILGNYKITLPPRPTIELTMLVMLLNSSKWKFLCSFTKITPSYRSSPYDIELGYVSHLLPEDHY